MSENKQSVNKYLVWLIVILVGLLVFQYFTDKASDKKLIKEAVEQKEKEIDSLTRLTDKLYIHIWEIENDPDRVAAIDTLNKEIIKLKNQLKNANKNINKLKDDILDYGGTVDQRFDVFTDNLSD